MSSERSYDPIGASSKSLHGDGVIVPATQKSQGMIFSEHSIGTIMCLVGVLILTPDTLLLRMLSDIPIFPIIFFRHLLITASCTTVLLLYQKTNTLQKIKAIGKTGFLAGVVWGISNFLITYAFLTANVGNVLVILASNPMFSAILSYFLLGEVVKLHTFIASLVCFAAIVVISITAIGSNSDSQAIIGILAAIGSTITLSLYFVLIRVTEKVNG
ncbi:EamA family transporter [archaeon]|nr:MAG: EamA family transporter [archaeon]